MNFEKGRYLWSIALYGLNERSLPGVGIGLGCGVFSCLLLSYAGKRQLANLEKMQGSHKEK